MEAFEVSVIVPVYNAGPYLRQAVESALAQPEAREIILVEDRSPDDSYAICQQLAAERPDRVRLYTHPGHENRGAGETRNLGIRNATRPYICFLDADDYMLPGRFAKARAAIERHPACDGIYEAVGIHFENEKARADWYRIRNYEITTVQAPIAPKQLFYKLSPIGGPENLIHTNGWTFKRSILDRSGLFNPELKLHQDSDLFMRMCLVGSFLPGSIAEPIAVRRLHGENRITAARPKSQYFAGYNKMWSSIFKWTSENGYRRASYATAKRLLELRLNMNLMEGSSAPAWNAYKELAAEYRGTATRAVIAAAAMSQFRKTPIHALRMRLGALKKRIRSMLA